MRNLENTARLSEAIIHLYLQGRSTGKIVVLQL